MSLTSHFYAKTTADSTARSYASDGEGELIEKFTKAYTISTAVAADATLVLHLISPLRKIYAWTAQIRTAAGVIVTLDADVHEFVLDDETNILTITAKGGGIPQDAILTIYFDVGSVH